MENQELKDRFEAKRHELQAKWNKLKADTRAETKDERESVKRKLQELEDAVRGGWDNMTNSVKETVNRLLDDERTMESKS